MLECFIMSVGRQVCVKLGINIFNHNRHNHTGRNTGYLLLLVQKKPHLTKHLATMGIVIAELQKKEKSLTELVFFFY
jgi:hypothetical protein